MVQVIDLDDSLRRPSTAPVIQMSNFAKTFLNLAVLVCVLPDAVAFRSQSSGVVEEDQWFILDCFRSKFGYVLAVKTYFSDY